MMKSLVVSKFDIQPRCALEERPIPEWKEGFALVRMHAATVNPLSQMIATGQVGTAKAPIVLSNDGAGIVEKSSRFPAGTRVAIYGGGELGITEDGLQQQWVLVDDHRLFELPANLDMDEGAALPINYVTAFQALTRLGQVQRGQTILVSGAAGALGRALVQIASALGATVIGIVSTKAKVPHAMEAGASHVINMSAQLLQEQIAEITDNAGVDTAFDIVGGEMLGRLVRAVRPRGAVVSIGFVGGHMGGFDIPDLVVNEKKILGYDAWLETPEDVIYAFQRIREFVETGYIKPRIDSFFSLENHSLAYTRLKSRKTAGTILLRLQAGESRINHDN